MFGIKDGKIESKLKEILSRLDRLNREKVGTDMGTMPLNEHQALEIRQELMDIIVELEKVIGLSHKLHGLVKGGEEIQAIIDKGL